MALNINTIGDLLKIEEAIMHLQKGMLKILDYLVMWGIKLVKI